MLYEVAYFGNLRLKLKNDLIFKDPVYFSRLETYSATGSYWKATPGSEYKYENKPKLHV